MDSKNLGSAPEAGRRAFLNRAASISLGALALGFAHVALAAAPPKETGLSFEGLLKAQAGFQPRRPAPLPLTAIPGFLSRAQLARNYSTYRMSFADLLTSRAALAVIPRDPAHADEYKRQRTRQVIAGNSVLLHEFYFRNLASAPRKPSGYVLANMSEHMGPLASWREDFLACARVAEAWAVLSYDPYDDRWHNVPLGHADAGGWVGSNPLVVCDVAADAWSLDYKEREPYLAGFLEHVDWDVVAARYRQVDRH